MSDGFNNDPLSDARSAMNPLGMMAQRFREMTGPRPAPRAPLNIEQQAAADQQPQPQPQPPRSIMYNWANNFLPPGSRYPRERPFQPFSLASIQRSHAEWGQPEEFPQLPQSFEIPPLAQGLSKYFGQNGSQNVAQIAMMFGPAAGTFLEAFQKGRTEAARLQLDQLKLRAAQFAETQSEEMTRYSDVTSEHMDKDGNPTKLVNGRSYLEDMARTATELMDTGKAGTLGDLIQAGATPNDIINFLHRRDLRTRDLQKLKAAVDDTTVSDAEWNTPPSQQGARQQQRPLTPAEEYTGGLRSGGGEAPAPVSTGAPAPAAPQATPLRPDPAAPPAADGQETAHDAQVNEGISGVLPDAQFAKQFPAEYKRIILDIDKKRAQLNDIFAHPPQDRSQIPAMVRRISPTVGSDLEGVLNYKRPASGGVSGTGAQMGTRGGQYANLLTSLAMAADPDSPGHRGWNQAYYQGQNNFRNNRMTQTILLRVKDIAPMANRIDEDLKIMTADLKKRGLSTTNVNLDGFLQMFGNDYKYVDLRKDFNAYNEAYNTIITAGHNTITGVKLQEEGINPYAPIATYRGVMLGHARGIDGMINGVKDQWMGVGGREDNMPYADTPNALADFKTISDIGHWDIVSGARPYDPTNKDNDMVIKKAGPWGPAGRYYWIGANHIERDAPENWKRAD